MFLFKQHLFSVLISIFIIVLGNIGFLQAQSNSPGFSIKTVNKRLSNALADKNLTEEDKSLLKKLADKIKASMQESKDWREKIELYKQDINSADQEIKKYGNKYSETAEIKNYKELSVEELENQVNRLESTLEKVENKRDEINKNVNTKAGRRAEIPKQIVSLKDKINDLENQTSEAKKNDSVKAQLESMLIKAEIATLENEVKAYNKELSMYAATTDLMPVKQDFHNRKVRLLEKKITQIKKFLAEKRAEEAEAIAEKVQNKSYSHPALEQIAQRNKEFASMLTGSEGIIEKLCQATRSSDKAMEELDKVKKLFSDIKTKVDATGMTPALGLYMRNKKNAYSSDIYLQDKRKVIPEIQTQLLRLDEERSELSDIYETVDRLIEKHDKTITKKEEEQIRQAARKAFEIKRKLLDKIIKNMNLYFIELVELDTYMRLYISKVKEFRLYIDEHVIWYKSASKLNADDLKNTYQFLVILGSHDAWQNALDKLYYDFLNNFFVYIIFIIFLICLSFCFKKIDRSIKFFAKKVKKYKTDSLFYTFRTMFLSLLYAIPFPLIFLFIGLRLHINAEGNYFIYGLSKAFLKSGLIYLILRIIAQVCRKEGLGDRHFKWTQESLALFKKHLRWFTPAIVGLFFLSALVSAFPTDTLINGKSFHRFIFIVKMLVFAYFFFNVINPFKGPVKRFIKRSKGIWAERLSYLWYFASAAFVLMAILAILGYFYTAVQLNSKLQMTLLVLLSVTFIYGLGYRFLFFVRLKIAFERLQEKKKQEEERDKHEDSEKSVEDDDSVGESENLYTMGQDTKKFLTTAIIIIMAICLWFIWKDLFPAFKMFDRIELWSTSQKLTETIKQSGDDVVQTIQKSISVTLSDIFMSVFSLILTFFVVRNIAGIIQISLLQHLPINKGSRFAIITITKYAVILVGILISFSYIGISWSKVQWLVTAVSVGLGFGLQEIFANFISGLIILLEQPIRVGDTVTIGDVTGFVSRIKIRATTITDWDKKELIVPNKEFITSRLVNWSLSDKLIRLTVPVGIAYGSDVKKAEKTLYEVAEKQPDVLADPPPRVLFEEFADSALTFELRAFVSSVDYYISTKHDLHMKINEAFRKAEIEIAFPQQDIHIRSVEAPFTVQHKQEKS
ncbi:MAG: mechanosensitive ion channel [Verrucomicrobiota bacterium]|nr:mechanosensitive ion channel [Verrucomicrobiota bacterium]